jgi:hypothetical protein
MCLRRDSPGNDLSLPGRVAETASDAVAQDVMSLVRSHPLIAFFVLAYALSWWTSPFYYARISPFFPDFPFLATGTLLAGLIVVAVASGRAGLRGLGTRMIRWRVGWGRYAAALGIPLGVTVVTVALRVALGAPVAVLTQVPPLPTFLLVFAVRLIDPIDGPMAEEPGWRGYALPQLQRSGRSPLWATAILALLAAGWHLPLIVAQQLPPPGLLGAFAVTVWYTWLYNHTGGSVFMTVVMHAAEGTFGQLAAVGVSEGADFPLAFSIYVALTCVVAVGLVVLDGRAWRGVRVEISPARRRT